MLPETGFLRLAQIIGQRPITQEQADSNRAAGRANQRARSGVPAIIPLSAAAWWRGVKTGRFPQPVKHGRSTLWRVEAVRALVDEMSESGK